MSVGSNHAIFINAAGVNLFLLSFLFICGSVLVVGVWRSNNAWWSFGLNAKDSSIEDRVLAQKSMLKPSGFEFQEECQKRCKKIFEGQTPADPLKTNLGKPFSLGIGEQGQLGRKIMPRQEESSCLVPRSIAFRPYKLSAKFSRSFCGAYHTFLVHENESTVFAFGLNNYGQLGVGYFGTEDSEEQFVEVPTVVVLPEGRKVVDISGGEHHSLILLNDGLLFLLLGLLWLAILKREKHFSRQSV